MKTLFFSILFMGNFFLSTPTASDYFKKELEDQILTTNDTVIRLSSVAFSAVSDPLTFHTRQDDFLIAQSILASLLENYFILTGEQFIFSNETSLVDSTLSETSNVLSVSPTDTSSSEQFKERLEQLTHEILTIYNDVIKLAAIRIPLNADPSAFAASQEDLSIAQSILASLLEDYATLTGEQFIFPNEISPVDSTLSETSIVLSVSPTDTPSSEQFKERLEQLTHEILTVYNDVIKLAAIRTPLNTDPSAFAASQEDLAITYAVLTNLLEDYFTLTGEPFLLPEIASPKSSPTTSTESQSTEESTSDTRPLNNFPINTPFDHNGFRATYAGRNNGKTSQENRLKEAQQNSLLPVQFINPENLCQLKLVRPNKTPRKPAEQSSAM